MLGRVFLVVGSSLTSLGIYYAIAFWLIEFLLRNQLITLWVFTCSLFSLVAFNNLSLIFAIYYMCLSVFLLGFILPGTLCPSGLV